MRTLLWRNNQSAYKAYQNAKYRCRNPKAHCFKDYGGRGIEFRFESFEQFLNCIGPKPDGYTLERKDNAGHYEPGNVAWATRKSQARNRRSNCYIIYKNEKITLSELSERTKIPRPTLQSRLDKGQQLVPDD